MFTKRAWSRQLRRWTIMRILMTERSMDNIWWIRRGWRRSIMMEEMVSRVALGALRQAWGLGGRTETVQMIEENRMLSTVKLAAEEAELLWISNVRSCSSLRRMTWDSWWEPAIPAQIPSHRSNNWLPVCPNLTSWRPEDALEKKVFPIR